MYISILRSTIRTRHSVFAIVSVLATPGVRRGGASVGVGVGVVGGDTVGYGGMGIRWDTVALAGGGWEYGGVGHVTLSAAPLPFSPRNRHISIFLPT